MIRERRGKWQVRVYAGIENGKRKHLVETVATHADAKDRERQLELDVKAGRNASAAKMTVEELFERWLKESGPDLSPKTLQEYRGMLKRHIVPAIGAMPITKLTTARLDELYSDLRAKLDPQTIRHVHALIRKAFNVAIRKGYLTRNPTTNASPPTVKRPTIQPPDPEQLRAFIATLRPELAMYVRLASITGCRRGEMVGLQWSDFDDGGPPSDDPEEPPPTGTLTIRRALIVIGRGQVISKSTKTDRVRSIALDPVTTAMLVEHRAREHAKAAEFGVKWKPAAPIFTGDPGVPWRPDLASGRFRRAAKKAKLPARLHDLRHWAPTYALAAGHSVRQVGDRGGWADSTMVLTRYGHSIPTADQAIAESLAAHLDG